MCPLKLIIGKTSVKFINNMYYAILFIFIHFSAAFHYMNMYDHVNIIHLLFSVSRYIGRSPISFFYYSAVNTCVHTCLPCILSFFSVHTRSRIAGLLLIHIFDLLYLLTCIYTGSSNHK